MAMLTKSGDIVYELDNCIHFICSELCFARSQSEIVIDKDLLQNCQLRRCRKLGNEPTGMTLISTSRYEIM